MFTKYNDGQFGSFEKVFCQRHVDTELRDRQCLLGHLFAFVTHAQHTGAGDVMIVPGGMPGSKNLARDKALIELMQRHFAAGGTVAAICAAPGLVASQLEGLEGRRFTCFDGFQEPLLAKGAVYVPDGTVTDGNLITGRGAGHAVGFGLAIVEYLKGKEAAQSVRHGLML